jgi:hypothetical protein
LSRSTVPTGHVAKARPTRASSDRNGLPVGPNPELERERRRARAHLRRRRDRVGRIALKRDDTDDEGCGSCGDGSGERDDAGERRHAVTVAAASRGIRRIEIDDSRACLPTFSEYRHHRSHHDRAVPSPRRRESTR